MTPTAVARLETGFTLVEMLVVLTIIGLLAAIAMSNLSLRPAFVDRARLRTALGDALSTARQSAATSGRATVVDLSRVQDPSLNYQPALGAPSARLTVYPDGTTSGGMVSRQGHPLLTIDWMTGRVADAPR